MKKKKFVHTTKAGTVTEILKALKISKKEYNKVVKEIQQLEKKKKRIRKVDNFFKLIEEPKEIEFNDPFPIR